MADLLRSIAAEFAGLVTDEGFSISESTVKPEEFGNASLVIDSAAFKVRIYTDRGQRFVDVGKDGLSWHKLEYVLEFLEPGCSQAWFGEPPQLDKLSAVLRRNIHPVARLLAGDLAASGFTMFEKQKSADLVAKIFSKSDNGSRLPS